MLAKCLVFAGQRRYVGVFCACFANVVAFMVPSSKEGKVTPDACWVQGDLIMLVGVVQCQHLFHLLWTPLNDILIL